VGRGCGPPLAALSADPGVHGILLQHPVRAHIDERAAFEAIHPAKEVDGVTLHSFDAMAFGLTGFPSATPGAIMALLDHYGVPLSANPGSSPATSSAKASS